MSLDALAELARETLTAATKAAAVKPDPDPTPPELPAETEAVLNRWLDHIGEHDAQTRAALLNNCRRNPSGLAGLLAIVGEAGIAP